MRNAADLPHPVQFGDDQTVTVRNLGHGGRVSSVTAVRMIEPSATGTTYDSAVDLVAPTPRVLVIGLDPYRVPGPWDPKPVADAIEAGMLRFAEHGVGAQSCLFGLDGSDDVEAVVAAALGARPWECVVVGGGVREAEGQLELFERVVNLVRRHAPDAAIAFNATPADTFDAAARWVDLPR